MKDHLSQEDLVNCQFELGSDEQASAWKQHLAECESCRTALAKLKAKFSSLDLLNVEMVVPQNLVNDLLNKVQSAPVSTRIITWPRMLGLTAAAAVILILAAPHLFKDPDLSDPQLAAKPGMATSKEIAVLKAEEPFPPASAIELNVLPTRDDVQLTIYNSADLTLVREKRNLTMKAGWNWMQFMWVNTLIDPTSLRLEPMKYKDKIDVQALVFPPRLGELGRWLIFSEVSGQVPVEITYLTSGLSWRAFYMGTMSPDEKTMKLEAYVRVINKSGEDYEEAQTRLIVGEVHLLDEVARLARRKYPYGRPIDPYATRESGKDDDERRREKGKYVLWSDGPPPDEDEEGGELMTHKKDIKKEGLSEYFLYTIEGKETIPHRWAKRLPSFDVSDIPIESLYKYDEERWGRSAMRFVSFANDKDHKLGETPIPNGRMRIYRRLDEEKHLAYVGGAEIKYVPIEEDIELDLGRARQVVVEPKLMNYKTDNYLYNGRGDVAGWDEIREWRITVKNTRKIPVTLEITRGFNRPHWTLEPMQDGGYEKHDATHARFNVELEPGSKKEIIYRATTYHGTREQFAK